MSEAKPNLLTPCWEKFRNDCLQSIPEYQQIGLQGIFYAGAGSILLALKNATDEIGDDEERGAQLVEDIMLEIKRTAEESLLIKLAGMTGMTKEQLTKAMKGNPQ